MTEDAMRHETEMTEEDVMRHETEMKEDVMTEDEMKHETEMTGDVMTRDHSDVLKVVHSDVLKVVKSCVVKMALNVFTVVEMGVVGHAVVDGNGRTEFLSALITVMRDVIPVTALIDSMNDLEGM